jgi:hypothetical protein
LNIWIDYSADLFAPLIEIPGLSNWKWSWLRTLNVAQSTCFLKFLNELSVAGLVVLIVENSPGF